MRRFDDRFEQAACSYLPEHEKAWFFAESGSLYKKAQAICRDCPVRVPCLEMALEMERDVRRHEDRLGVWGGLTGRGRQRLVDGVA